MSSSKSLSLFYLCSIIFFISGCSSNIYQKFEEPILVENVFELMEFESSTCIKVSGETLK